MPRALGLCLAALAGLFMPVPAAAQLGDYSSHRLTASGVEIVAGADTLRFSLYAPDVVRVDFRPRGAHEPVASSVVIRGPSAAPPLAVTDQGDALWVSTSRLGIRVTKHPVRVSFRNAGGTELLAEPAAGGFLASGTRRRIRFALPPELHLYGTGERGIGPDLRGHGFGTWNTQSYGYGGPLETMGINVPFLATSGGFALYFESPLPARFDLGQGDPAGFSYEIDGGELSCYLMAAPDVPGQIERYTWLTGRQPLPPQWALGYIQSKFGYRNRREAEAMVEGMRARGIPADALVLDLYWFAQMGDLAWNTAAFPDPAGMIEQFRGRGFKTIVITEPNFTQRSLHFPFLAGEGKAFVGRTPAGAAYRIHGWWSCGCDALLFDMTNPAGRLWLWDRYAEFMSTGVAGLWTDLGEPETHPADMQHALGPAAEVHNIYNLLWAKALFEGFSRSEPDGRIVNLTRSGYAGIQRYGVFTWSGDVARSFSGLAVQRPILLNAALSGLAYQSSDLGGFVGSASPELYIRWLQFGAFNPVMRAHGVDNQGTEPWAYGAAAETIARDMIRIRYRLLPYIYTLARENHDTGMPLARPLFFADPGDPELADADEAYLFGPDFLVAPVVAEGQREQSVHLPRGAWIDYWDDSLHVGGRRVRVAAPLERLPLFVRAGAIIPMQPVMDYAGQQPADSLLLAVYPTFSAEPDTAMLYEDDGVSLAYQRGAFARTRLEQRVVGETGARRLELTVGAAVGSYPEMPARKSVTATLHRIAAPPTGVTLNGRPLAVLESRTELARAAAGYFHDAALRQLVITLPHEMVRSSVVRIAGLAELVDPPGEPTPLRLSANAPNPFRDSTEIRFELPRAGRVTLDIFDASGGRVTRLLDAERAAGPQTVSWEGRNGRGAPAPAGIYLIVLSVEGAGLTRKMTLVR